MDLARGLGVGRAGGGPMASRCPPCAGALTSAVRLSGCAGVADEGAFLWFGWLGVLLGLVFGVVMLRTFPPWLCLFTPITQRRIDRFRSIKRGHRALLILGFLALIASLDHLVVGNEPLVMKVWG